MQYKKVAPVGDRVFVKIDKEEDKTTSGILLPSSAQKKPTQGEIVDIGDAKALKVRWLQLNLATVPNGGVPALSIITKLILQMPQFVSV